MSPTTVVLPTAQGLPTPISRARPRALVRSLVELDGRDRNIRAATADVDVMHQLVMGAYRYASADRGRQARADLAILYAVDVQGTRVRLLTQALCPPRWSLPQEAVIRGPEVWEQSTWHPAGTRLLFQLTANASARPRPFEGTSRRVGRVALTRQSDLAQWLTRRAAATGFSLDLDTEAIGKVTYLRSHRLSPPRDERRHERNAFAIGVTRFRGTLTVEDPDLFAAALVHGIGQGKPYGCGMLLVRPPQGDQPADETPADA